LENELQIRQGREINEKAATRQYLRLIKGGKDAGGCSPVDLDYKLVYDEELLDAWENKELPLQKLQQILNMAEGRFPLSGRRSGLKGSAMGRFFRSSIRAAKRAKKGARGGTLIGDGETSTLDKHEWKGP